MTTNKLWAFLTAGLCMSVTGVSTAAETDDTPTLSEITVTGTREGRLLSETPATVGIVKGQDIRATSPKHPSELMGRLPGVWVSITGGEGHMTAIRQPLTTNPVYLYLEDGIPTRATGFFNHNALYEINVPQAGGIEVTKGPGSALYGSDAIGGVINVLTRPAPLKPEAEVTVDVGQWGWKRALISGGNTVGNDGWRADLNLTSTDGWRDQTAYGRQSGSLRWDRILDANTVLKTVATFSTIDQETAGTSTISKSDYDDHPTRNYTPISLRKVQAFRLSTAYERESGNTLLSITPYYRNNDMDLLANWSLGYDPTVYNTFNQSLGVMAKYRRDFEPYRARLIVGVDIDHSPGERLEKSISPTKVTKDGNTYYTAYTEGQTIYDYDVTYQGVSPYLHGEMSPSERVRLTAGLRYDDVGYDYHNNLPDADIVVNKSFSNTFNNLTYKHPASTKVNYNHLSPKFGATVAFSPALSGFAAYNHAFRAPSEGQLFRQGSTLNTVGLKPIKSDSYEIGLRGKSGGTNYEVSLYRMTKTDDIVSFQATSTDPRESRNAGKTLHRGVELGIGADLAPAWRLDVSYSYAKHSYEEMVASNTLNYNGKEMETAPRVIANTRVSYAPGAWNGGRVSLEWVSLGSYWIDAANTIKYDGHDLFNLRASYPLKHSWEVFGSVSNLTDKRFADSSSFVTVAGKNVGTFAPGLPRTVYAGIRYTWK